MKEDGRAENWRRSGGVPLWWSQWSGRGSASLADSDQQNQQDRRRGAVAGHAKS